MRKIFCLSLIIFFLIVTPETEAACLAMRKLSRGAITITAAPLEIPKQTRIYWKKGAEKTPHVLVWIFCGAVKGGVNMIARTTSGIWDIVTFPIPIPKDYKPLVDPNNL